MNDRDHKIIADAITTMSIFISMRQYKKAESGAKDILAAVQRLIRNTQ